MPTLREKGQENFTASVSPSAEKCLLTPENPRIPNILSGRDPQGSGIHPLAVPRPPHNPTLCLRVARPGQAFPSFCSSRSTKFHQKEPKRGSAAGGSQGMRVGRSKELLESSVLPEPLGVPSFLQPKLCSALPKATKSIKIPPGPGLSCQSLAVQSSRDDSPFPVPKTRRFLLPWGADSPQWLWADSNEQIPAPEGLWRNAWQGIPSLPLNSRSRNSPSEHFQDNAEPSTALVPPGTLVPVPNPSPIPMENEDGVVFPSYFPWLHL